jgi:hypothetical protein
MRDPGPDFYTPPHPEMVTRRVIEQPHAMRCKAILNKLQKPD